MEFESQIEKEIIQQKEDMIRQLAFETAKRLNGVKPTSIVPFYECQTIQQVEKKIIKHGPFNLFSKEIEENVKKNIFVEGRHDLDGWILDDSLLEEFFEFGHRGVHLTEYRKYYILNKDGHLEMLIFCYDRSGIIQNSIFPHREDCVEIKQESRIFNDTSDLFNDSSIHWKIPDIALLDMSRKSWTTKRDDGSILIRNYPHQIDEVEQINPIWTKSDVVANYGDALIKLLKNL
ncbi:hypothetical protein [Streptococcus equi]|uniref:hypothetical protein n=1 Tax=Streptococcus equi TaxID=1336 RepID=UPI000DA40A1D|nr:hypothetical protein [Streptococcus equi]MCD3391232.1 hypothetical protein [Streptococcus equi subsp. zooepidemicus]MCD3460747.1 hypothetical protein [Streptococcus equi subsp. zooepidemicus]SQF05802.1 Uncharacterised protein [Streptococcus equi subsp. zooepidemicus]HEK9980141.1 hypothetical protein [Streptococcus equi subsp. zooepidemicus]HEL0623357.1 hypothetical protein [Streptococcus equi subsp. zooepidemicus]